MANLTKVTFADYPLTIDSSAFVNCNNLSIEFPKTSFVDVSVNSFKGCTIESLSIGNNTNLDIESFIKSMGSSLKAIDIKNSDHFISDLSEITNSLRNITLISSEISFEQIANKAEMKNLQILKILMNLNSTISSFTFNNWKIETLDLSETVVETISPEAFYNCKNLKELKLPNTLKTISENSFVGIAIESFNVSNNYSLSISSFKDCKSLSKIYLDSNFENFSIGYFIGCNIQNVILNSGSLDNYFFRNSKLYMNLTQRSVSTKRSIKEINKNEELLFVPPNDKNIILNSSYDKYAFSYVNDYSMLVDPSTFNFDEFIKTCDNNQKGTILTTSEVKNYNTSYFDCTGTECKFDCSGKLTPKRIPPIILPISSSSSSSSSVSNNNQESSSVVTTVFEDGKVMQQSKSSTSTKTESAIYTNSTIASVIISQDESGVASMSTTYVNTIIYTYIITDTNTETIVWVAFSDDNSTTKSAVSIGKIIGLVCGAIAIVFILAFMGVYLYRRTKDDPDKADKESSDSWLNEDIGHVVSLPEENENQFLEVVMSHKDSSEGTITTAELNGIVVDNQSNSNDSDIVYTEI
ncbi:hypothetical protein TVAG_149670 [Trichomonas vaginalis G3]|uniref:Surface antigen BspA-like n=1 Tax=Trichomonas vaginalis (strain ATCC PRA-98 / G3) TaxID=412133 RepID=A2FIK0_TRIV3|nr:ribonuclease inhibitor domain-containing protein [Trichomonas vaginalis G3]EAX95249.1 hypothetical protein TVAG_149670 [Trichomonas vaginalis G3]KAI5531920.1 ribonuclease inhibitor domain-containing protein [Trichomonas vaginalis G3]|eukprot:XP_001308179.1 hypothetical protein [Trichomonas vaginalis G3]